MKECKILEFEIIRKLIGKKSANTVDKGQNLVISDYPEIENKINTYLSNGWVITNISSQKYMPPPNAVMAQCYDYITVLLTR